jgi:hypothetical protein
VEDHVVAEHLAQPAVLCSELHCLCQSAARVAEGCGPLGDRGQRTIGVQQGVDVGHEQCPDLRCSRVQGFARDVRDAGAVFGGDDVVPDVALFVPFESGGAHEGRAQEDGQFTRAEGQALTEGQDTGTGHQHVLAAEVGDDLLNKPVDGILVADVATETKRNTTAAARQAS